MILALLLSLIWDPSTDPTVDHWQATAWILVPVLAPCPEPDLGLCLSLYNETWRQTMTVSTPQADWTAPELPSGGVAFFRVDWAARADGCTSSGQVP